MIPQYCTAHNNTQQNIMAAFLAGKLVREKNGRFEGHGWEKEVEICGKEGKDINMSESFEIVESAKTSFLS